MTWRKVTVFYEINRYYLELITGKRDRIAAQWRMFNVLTLL